MQKKLIDKVIDVVQPFVPIDKKIRPYPDPKVPEYMYKLVTDDAAYQSFTSNPIDTLKNAGIDVEKLDVDRFADLAKALRDRARGVADATIMMPPSWDHWKSQVSDAGYGWNFDNSASWIFMKESAIFTSRGRYKEKSTTEETGISRNFSRSGAESFSEQILKHELDLLFFPAQPLVTPELVDKIKDILSKEE